MVAYLLDTNILSDLIRNPNGVVKDSISSVGEQSVATSILVAAELRFGAEKRGSPRLKAQVEAILDAIVILPWEVPADILYGKIRADLEMRGQIIGANDLLIAAHALSLSRTLVTDKVAEFQRIKGLDIENWLRI